MSDQVAGCERADAALTGVDDNEGLSFPRNKDYHSIRSEMRKDIERSSHQSTGEEGSNIENKNGKDWKEEFVKDLSKEISTTTKIERSVYQEVTKHPKMEREH